MAPSVDGTVRIDTHLDTKKFNAGAKKMSDTIAKLGAAIGLAFGAAALVGFGKIAVDAASALSSALIGLKSILDGTGKDFKQAQTFIAEFTKDGLVPATNAITAYKNLALRGFSTEQIEKTLIALKDASAFGRQASLTMGEAVQSATEGLKNENSILVDNAGVTKNVAKMWKDYAESIGTTADKLTKAQKIMAEVQGIQEETRFQTGDAAKAADTYSGKISALSVSFLNLKVAAGNAIIPVVSRVLPVIKAVVDQLAIWFAQVAQFVGILFGVDVNAGIKGMEDTADAANNAADAQAGLADKTKEAGKAAKGALAGFDELNVLQQKEDTGTAATEDVPGAGVIGGVIGDPTLTDGVLDDLKKKVEDFKAGMLGLLQPAIDGLWRLQEALAPLGQTIWEGLKWGWDNIIVPFGAFVIQNIVPAFLDLLAAGATLLNNALIALQPLGIWLWENFLQPIATWTGGAIIDILTWLRDRLVDIGNWIKENPQAFQTMTGIILAFAAAWVIVNAAVGLWSVIAGIAAIATTAFGAAVAFLTSPIGIAIIVIGLLILAIALLIKNWDWVKESALKAWDVIKAKWGEASDWFTRTVVEPIKTGINAFIAILNAFFLIVESSVNGVIDTINKVKVTVPDWVPGLGGKSLGFTIPHISPPNTIPYLASGAVIPPNSQFMAVLGDQRSGRNIEAPETLLRQIVAEELGRIQADISIEFAGSLGALVRELKPHIMREDIRIGKSLAVGGIS